MEVGQRKTKPRRRTRPISSASRRGRQQPIHRQASDVPKLTAKGSVPGQYREPGSSDERFGISWHNTTEQGLVDLLNTIESGKLGTACVGSPHQAAIFVGLERPQDRNRLIAAALSGHMFLVATVRMHVGSEDLKWGVRTVLAAFERLARERKANLRRVPLKKGALQELFSAETA